MITRKPSAPWYKPTAINEIAAMALSGLAKKIGSKFSKLLLKLTKEAASHKTNGIKAIADKRCIIQWCEPVFVDGAILILLLILEDKNSCKSKYQSAKNNHHTGFFGEVFFKAFAIIPEEMANAVK